MEFKSLTNLESSFKTMRLTCIIFLISCVLITLFAVWSAYSFAEKQRQKVYVLDQGKSLMVALSQDLSQNRPAEAREHITRFHELFFNLSPDKSAIENNIKRALFLADKTAFVYFKNLTEKGYYNKIISANINQIVQVDSIAVDFNSYPYQVTTYAKQRIIRETNITERSLISQCNLINTLRSDNNPQGFMIEQFQIIENKDIQTFER